MVEQRYRKPQVAGSSPVASSNKKRTFVCRQGCVFWMMFAFGKWWRLCLMMFAMRMMCAWRHIGASITSLQSTVKQHHFKQIEKIISPQAMMLKTFWYNSKKNTKSTSGEVLFYLFHGLEAKLSKAHHSTLDAGIPFVFQGQVRGATMNNEAYCSEKAPRLRCFSFI